MATQTLVHGGETGHWDPAIDDPAIDPVRIRQK